MPANSNTRPANGLTFLTTMIFLAAVAAAILVMEFLPVAWIVALLVAAAILAVAGGAGLIVERRHRGTAAQDRTGRGEL